MPSQKNKSLPYFDNQTDERSRTFTGLRDYTMILLFLETGIRVSEAVAIKVEDIRMKEGRILIHGKGSKQRWVPFQSRFRRALQENLLARGESATDALFCSVDEEPMTTRLVQMAIRDYGQKARITGVRCSPHTPHIPAHYG